MGMMNGQFGLSMDVSGARMMVIDDDVVQSRRIVGTRSPATAWIILQTICKHWKQGKLTRISTWRSSHSKPD